MKFFDALQELYRLKHQEAVWEDVAAFLSKHVDNDVNSAVSEIRSDDAGIVPQDIVADIIKRIQKEKLAPLEEAIKRYTDLEVGNGEEEEEGRQRKAAAAKVTGKKKPAVRRKQGAAAGRNGASAKRA
jgi:hypothetical protein